MADLSVARLVTTQQSFFLRLPLAIILLNSIETETQYQYSYHLTAEDVIEERLKGQTKL